MSIIKENSYFKPKFGKIGIKSLSNFNISGDQLEMCRRVIVKTFQKKIKFWINIKCNVPLTSKPVGTRMGKGKGSIKKIVFPVKKGRILFEFNNINYKLTKECCKRMQKKLPTKLTLVKHYL